MKDNTVTAREARIADVESLKSAIGLGFRPRYLFFYSHRARAGGGQIGKACLSQWWLSEFEVDNDRYASAEHFMMAEKARLFGDQRALSEILEARHPAEAKKLGRQVKGFNEDVWVRYRFDIVVRGNLAKFSQSEPLKDFLLGTFDQFLVEANPTDSVWGIGLAEDDRRSKHPGMWRGLNLMGFALMEVRSRLWSDS